MKIVGSRYAVAVLVAPDGERLPMLVDRGTGVPCQVSLRWSLAERRGRVAASTMADDLRSVQHLYEWAEVYLEDGLDEHLTRWGGFSRGQAGALAAFVKTKGGLPADGNTDRVRRVLSPSSFNNYWLKIVAFLCWAADLYSGNGELDPRERRRMAVEEREWVERLLVGYLVRERIRLPAGVLTEQEWGAIMSCINLWREDVWPDPRIRFRNHVMVHLAANTGMRKGEMLKIKLDQIPRGATEYVTVKRNPDAPEDPRRYEPQVKTSERELVVPPFLKRSLGQYIARYRRSSSPYLFVAQSGAPLSTRGAGHVVERIGAVTGLRLGWHSFRHAFLDRFYERVADRENGLDLLAEWAGWSSPASAEPYVRRARQRGAAEVLASYQNGLYEIDGSEPRKEGSA